MPKQPTTPKRSHARRLAYYVIIIGIPACFFLIVTEFIIPHFLKVPHLVYRFWGDRPATFYPDMWHRAATREYDIRFRTNQFGFKDFDHKKEKRPGSRRVLLLGDSYIEAMGVPVDKHLARVMERVAARDGIDLEVIVMGMSGWGQAHYLATYERLGKEFDPDVVVTFFVGNDFWNNERDSVWKEPIYQFKNDDLVLALPDRTRPEKPLELLVRHGLNRFETYFVLRYGRAEIYKQYFADPKELEAAEKAADRERHVRVNNRTGLQPIAPDRQLRLFEALVKNIRAYMVDRDARMVVNVVVTFEAESEHSQEFLKRRSYVAKIYAQVGIANIDMGKRFQREFKRTKTLPRWKTDSHWNEDGHRMVGEELYTYLQPILRAN